jgi:hypothetical protein
MPIPLFIFAIAALLLLPQLSFDTVEHYFARPSTAPPVAERTKSRPAHEPRPDPEDLRRKAEAEARWDEIAAARAARERADREATTQREAALKAQAERKRADALANALAEAERDYAAHVQYWNVTARSLFGGDLLSNSLCSTPLFSGQGCNPDYSPDPGELAFRVSKRGTLLRGHFRRNGEWTLTFEPDRSANPPQDIFLPYRLELWPLLQTLLSRMRSMHHMRLTCRAFTEWFFEGVAAPCGSRFEGVPLTKLVYTFRFPPTPCGVPRCAKNEMDRDRTSRPDAGSFQ